MTLNLNFAAAVPLAHTWRQENGYLERGGVVVVFEGEVQGWVSTLRTPDHWQPGCIAVADTGECWTAILGDAKNGSLMWLPHTPLKLDE